MLNCKEVSRLVSQSLDRKLPLRQRVGVWFHLSMCRLCWGFRKELLVLRKAAGRQAEEFEKETSVADTALSKKAHERIQRALNSGGS